MSDYVLKIGNREYRARVEELTAESATIEIDGETYAIDLVEIARRSAAPAAVQRPAPRPVTAAAPASKPSTKPSEEAPEAVPAPLPGLILRVEVKEGDSVQAGQPLLVMEAMKMENVVAAPYQGKVRKIFVGDGDSVGEGDPLVEVGRPKMTTL